MGPNGPRSAAGRQQESVSQIDPVISEEFQLIVLQVSRPFAAGHRSIRYAGCIVELR